MTVDELKGWMEQRFDAQTSELREIKTDLRCLSEQVRCHDRWLWLLRGMGTIVLILLGFIGIKIRV